MCIIIENKTKQNLLSILDKSLLEKMIEINPDGFGITYLHSSKAITIKGFGLENLLKEIEKIENNHCCYYVHLRKATVGKVCLENNHPFDVSGDGLFYLMHNGTLPGFKQDINQCKTDTAFLAEKIKEHLHLIKNENVLKNIIENIIGDNRAVLINTNNTIIFNEQKWENYKGLKLSKTINNFI